MANLNFIRENGIKQFIEQQQQRMRLLEIMLEKFDEGRSRSFFCKAAAFLDVTSLQRSLNKATQKIKTDKIKQTDVKMKTKTLKTILSEIASKEGVELVTKKANK